ncbi:MAG: DUF2652 domain-containing protein [Roseivirga sp.]|nr:DUF2652 domain-containing protein [Roseivirga sp.]
MQQATILIPDISGYTRFLTKTELSHSTHIINELLQVIADSIQHRFTLAEIEGDALLTYAKGRVPQEEIEAVCREAFLNFHYFLKVIERDSVCRCGACQGSSNLSLKFVVHYGYFDEIRIAQFTKLSGPDMVIAHRLLKNSIPDTEYVLLTDDYLKNNEIDNSEFEWVQSADLYNVIGNVSYQYASLGHLRSQVESPESREDLIRLFGLAKSLEFDIAAPIALVHHVLTDNSEKVNFVQGLKNVEVDSAINRVGSSHICEFDGDSFDIQTLQDAGDNEDITYIEKARSVSTGHTMLAYYELIKVDEERTRLTYRGLTGDRKPLPEPMADMVYEQARGGLTGLKNYVESLFSRTRRAS